MHIFLDGKNIQYNKNYKKVIDSNTAHKQLKNDNEDKTSSSKNTKKAVFISTAAVLTALGIYLGSHGKYKNLFKKASVISHSPAPKSAGNKTAYNNGNIPTHNTKPNSNPVNNSSTNPLNNKTNNTQVNSNTTQNLNPANIKAQADNFIANFIKGQNKTLEKIILTLDFTGYGKKGIPLKYPREQFLQDINDTIKNLSPQRQEDILKQFNLAKGFNDIDGIPVINGKTGNSPEAQKIKALIEKFYYKNESTFADPEIKKAFDEIIKGFPEFNMITGKVQHGTHIYSVDVHSLKVLQKSMNNPSYAALSDEGKEILKLTALMHDFGKKGKVITKGHAAISRKEAELFIDNYNLPNSVKERVLNHIENHHWFEAYNKGILDEQGVKNLFKTPEDLEIAKILAKADFESINPSFHLNIMNPGKTLTQAEFDAEFALKTSKLGGLSAAKKTGRTLQEQITHLEKNYKKETVYTDLNRKQGSFDGSPVEKYSIDGHKDFWLKINNELYYVPENQSYIINKYSDDVYKILTGSDARIFEDLGHISKRQMVMGFDNKIYGYKYLPSRADITQNPRLIYDAFGADCLFSTPVNAKNIIIYDEKAVRLQNGMQPYIWSELLAPTPQKLFSEKVTEISKAFKAGTESAELLKNMTREDLIKSLEKVDDIPDAAISNLCRYENNYQFLIETLNKRKAYIKEFCNKLKNNPQLPAETMSEYTKRIESMMPEPKTYTAPMNDHLLKTLPKTKKDILEANWVEFQKLSGQKIVHNAADILQKDSLVHHAPLVNLESILDNGLVSGQINIGKKVMGSSVGGNTTSTPGQFDTFKVMKDESIKDYFILSNRSSYEQNWLPTSVKDHIVTFVVDNKSLSEKIKQSMQFHGNQIQNPTHFTIPFGVPANTIEKIVVSTKLQPQQIEHIKNAISKRGLDIKVYDIEGRLL